MAERFKYKMRLCTLLVLVCVLGTSLGQTLERLTCDSGRKMVDIDMDQANVVIGSLFEMRLPGSDGYGCGAPHAEALLAYEAGIWAMRRVNSLNYIPGIRLGMKAYDTCYSQYRAVAAANDFYPQYSSSSMYCNETGKMNLGMLGALTSWTTKPVAALLSSFPQNLISMAASSAELSDKTKYPYFLRTGISATEQVKAMTALMGRMSWQRILIVYSDNDYGRDLMKEFVRQSQYETVCVVEAIAVPASPDVTEYGNILQNIGKYHVSGAAYFGDHYSMKTVIEAVHKIPGDAGVSASSIQWMLSLVNLNDQFFIPRMRGVIFVQPEFYEVTEFFNDFVNINQNSARVENPWFPDWFMSVFQCKLPNVNYQPYSLYTDCTPKTAAQKMAAINTKYSFLYSTIQGVFAYAKALKNAQAAMCLNQGTLCNNLQNMSPQQFNTYLKAVNFDMSELNINSVVNKRVQFDANGDFLQEGHFFWNYNDQPSAPFSFKKVGDYIDNTLNVDLNDIYMYDTNRNNLLLNLPSSLCPDNGCRNCLVPRMQVNFDYMPGDVVIAGLFDIHKQGSEILTCGELKPSHAANVAAFQYAIRTVKQKFPAILPGVNLGSLAIDLCDNAETGRLLLNNILGGRAIVSDMHGQIVDPNQLKGVVGELDSTEAISMAAMLGFHRMPYVESSATSASLKDRMMYPTFSRTVPSDYKQMMAIILLLKRLGWNYVQVIHSNDEYGKSAYKMMMTEGANLGICVGARHIYHNSGSAAQIVADLQEKTEARAVIAIVDSGDYRVLLDQLQTQNQAGQFILIGTETWGRNLDIVDGLSGVAQGSITLEIVSPSMDDFRTWLSTLRPDDMDTMKDMPFFIEWYQYAFSCYLDATKKGTYTQQCNRNLGITQATMYSDSNYTPFMISATYVVARALDQTLRDICGDVNGNYDGICWQLRSDPDVMNKLLTHIRDAQYNLDNSEFKMMDGEGTASYTFYSYSGSTYQRIGQYVTETGILDMQFQTPLSLPTGFGSTCSGFCSDCVYLLQTNPFRLLPGPELKIGANLGLHYPESNDPFLCGDVQLTNGIQSALAMLYAVSRVNNGQAPMSLNNVKLGALILDHCNSPARANGLPSALYSGLLEARGTEEDIPNLNTIRGWITDNTMVTMEMKDFFSDLNLPVISTMASSNKFLNDEEYPTFVRTIQGDSTIATALAVLAKSLGLQYVTVLYSDNSFGIEGMDAFYGIAQQEGVCIIKAVKMGSDNIMNITNGLVAESTHAVVTYLTLADMNTFLEARGRTQNGDRLVVISPEPYPIVYTQRGTDARNLLSLNMKRNDMDDFHNFVASLDTMAFDEHPLIREYYQELYQCNLQGEYKYPSTCSNININLSSRYYTDNYILPTVNAVYTFTAAAHETLKIQCGENYDGVCSNFYSDPETNTILHKELMKVAYVDESGAQFQFTGKEGNTGREIMLFDGASMSKIADFAGASINFVDNFQNPFTTTISTCEPPCTQCINNMMNFTHIPGDILLGGIFDVHEAERQPFSCGNINTLRGFQLLEAFHFAINNVNDKNGMFKDIMKDIKLGGVGLDACQSSVRGGYIVSNIHNGVTLLQRDNVIIDPDTIDAYVGTYSSTRSIYLARLLKSLKMPQISYGSSSTELLDRDSYPYFLRTVPADDRQAMGMLKFLRKYNIRYVQVVHTPNSYGEQGAAIFNKLAVEEKVCVAQTISFPYDIQVTKESANDVVLALLKKPVANTVVVFADTEEINELLQAIQRNPEAVGKFKFVGSDTWANNFEPIENVEEIALGSVTVDLDVKDLRDFDAYLGTKTPANYPENPWFPEYYEVINDCYLTIPNARYPRKCPVGALNVIASTNYKQDTAIIHVINAVYSAAIGIDKALKQVCGADYTTVCEAFKNMDGRRDLVLEMIKSAEFTDLSNQEFSFSDRGDGNKGYVFHSIETSVVSGYEYKTIAKYNTENGLSYPFGRDYKPSWDGSCERKDSCTECPTIRNLVTRYMLPPYLESTTPATLIILRAIHEIGSDEFRCGEMQPGEMLDALAIIWTLERYGNNNNRAFNLRPLLLDYCNNQLRIDQDLTNIYTTGKLCNSNFDSGSYPIDASTVIGVQAKGSENVKAANRVSVPFKIQITSHTASSTALSDQRNYPYFTRTVPPDNIQMEVVAKILQAHDWSYVAVMYSQESYGINGFRALRDISNEKLYTCIGHTEAIPAIFDPAETRAALRRIEQKAGIGVIVLIVTEIRDVLQILVDEGIADKFVVIGTDTWGNTASISEGMVQQLRGAITVNFRNSFNDTFLSWLGEISYTNRKDIPNDWFEEFYQHMHQCRISTAVIVVEKFTSECTTVENGLDYEALKKWGVRNIGITGIAGAYAVAHALEQFRNENGCNNRLLGECLNRVQDAREKMFNKVLQQELDIQAGFELTIGDKRYWNIGYEIYNLKDGNVYDLIGESIEDEFTYNTSKYTSYRDVESKCPDDQYCDCNIALTNAPIQQAPQKYMRDHEPRNYFYYSENGEQMYTWPIWAIAVCVLSAIGLLVGVLLFAYFLIFYPVRGGTTVLGFFMMVGVFGIYAINIAFFYQASEITCGLREFLMGVVYAIVFAALLVKAIDNWRFKDTEYSTKRYVGIANPFVLLLMVIGIVLIQCIIPIEWLILRNPSASLMENSTQLHDWMWCDEHDMYDISMVLSMVFVVFLVALTAIFSALAWESESNYFESKWIFISSVCTAGCFLVWMVVSTNAGPPYRDPAVAIANFVNATALLICIPLRKFMLLMQFTSEEEKAKNFPNADDPNNELYSTVYPNAMYQSDSVYAPDVFQADSKPNSENNY